MIATQEVHNRPTVLGPGNFRKVAVNGFGDPHNAYAYSAVWFNDHLYIGTFRDALVLIKLRSPFEVQLPFWPVPVPESVWQADLRAQIWRYSPREDRWRRVYRSPLIQGREGFDVPLSVGFRNMAVFRGKSDPHPCIYTVTFSSSQGYGPVVLRSADGLHFEQVSEPALGLGDPNLRSFRGVRPFKGKLFATPAGSGGGQVNVSYNVAILCSDDPVQGNWQMSNEPAFGDPTNLTVFEMAVFNDHLYATTLNTRHGFQVWKTDGEGPPPHRWTKVLDRGADRGPLNQAVCGLCAFQGALYLGTGIQGGGIDRQNSVGPAAAELIRIYPDDSWDLVVGEPRLTRRGPVFPASGYGPGFDNFFAGYFWRLCAHEGAIYVGTYDWTTFLAYTPRDQWPESLKHLLTSSEVERLVESRAGAELWRSTDGNRWSPVTTNGMGNRFNYGIRTLISTPAGLIVGTANPFGGKVAVKKEGGFVYEDNPLGGVEIWQGSPEYTGGVGDGSGTLGDEGQPHWLRTDGTTPDDARCVNGLLADTTENDTTTLHAQIDDPLRDLVAADHSSRVIAATEQQAAGQASQGSANESFATEGASASGISLSVNDPVADDETYRVTYAASDRRRTGRPPTRDPILELARARRDLLIPGENVEEEVADYFGDSPLRCVGYWRSHSTTPARAARDLLDELVSLVPGRAALANADPLDSEPFESLWLVADATPAATEMLAELGVARQARIVDAKTLHGSPMADPTDRPDLIMWIEGPSAEGDRVAALRAARAWLRGGGVLLASEIVGALLDDSEGLTRPASGREELVQQCEADLRAAGFESGRVWEVTAKTWLRFFQHSRRYFLLKQMFRLIDESRCREVLAALPGGRMAVDAYLLMQANSPTE